MIIHDEYEQGSQQWIEAHCGIITASSFDSILTPKFEIRTGEMPKTLLSRKLAEAWGGPLPSHSQTFQMEQGLILEGEAIPWVEFEFGWKVRRVGFITTNDGRVGCSPDGLLDDKCGLEIKCPESPTHIKYLLNGELPAEYRCQVYGCMYVTGFSQWKFISYRRRLPPLVLTVNWDDEVGAKIAEALDEFLGRFDTAMSRLIELNGGEGPPKREPMVFSTDRQPEEVGEVVP